VSDTDETKALLEKYHELAARRKQSIDHAERTRLTRELMDLESQVRAAVKANPIPEPLGMDKLNKIADRMVELGFGIFANRLREQHYRHPIYVPFNDMDQLRSYIGEQMDDETLCKIKELDMKPKKPGLFDRLRGKK
jgi:hypothetical protein